MNSRAVAFATLALGVAFFLRRSNDDPLEYLYFDDWVNMDDPVLPDDSVSFEARLKAFLRLITIAETGSYAVETGENYRVFYGGSRFSNLSDHPVNTGEKKGIRLPDSWCRRAGLSPGCVSTAAGAYQIIRPTWEDVRRAGAWGPRLDDFGPAAQDEAARRILAQSGALDAIAAGDFDAALWRASSRWASLPGSGAGQPQITRDRAFAILNEGMGIFA